MFWNRNSVAFMRWYFNFLRDFLIFFLNTTIFPVLHEISTALKDLQHPHSLCSHHHLFRIEWDFNKLPLHCNFFPQSLFCLLFPIPYALLSPRVFSSLVIEVSEKRQLNELVNGFLLTSNERRGFCRLFPHRHFNSSWWICCWVDRTLSLVSDSETIGKTQHDDGAGEGKNIWVLVYFCGETVSVIFNDQFIGNISWWMFIVLLAHSSFINFHTHPSEAAAKLLKYLSLISCSSCSSSRVTLTEQIRARASLFSIIIWGKSIFLLSCHLLLLKVSEWKSSLLLALFHWARHSETTTMAGGVMAVRNIPQFFAADAVAMR